MDPEVEATPQVSRNAGDTTRPRQPDQTPSTRLVGGGSDPPDGQWRREIAKDRIALVHSGSALFDKGRRLGSVGARQCVGKIDSMQQPPWPRANTTAFDTRNREAGIVTQRIVRVRTESFHRIARKVLDQGEKRAQPGQTGCKMSVFGEDGVFLRPIGRGQH